MEKLTGERVVLVPVADDHVSELKRIRRTPEVRHRWGDVDTEPDWPFDDLGTAVYTILIDDTVRGLVQYGEENDPMYRHASLDIFLDPAVHGRGFGQDVVRTLARHLINDRGHHRLVIDPAADNERAIRCYTAIGFRPVGIMRDYERDTDRRGWHDALLMDLLADELHE